MPIIRLRSSPDLADPAPDYGAPSTPRVVETLGLSQTPRSALYLIVSRVVGKVSTISALSLLRSDSVRHLPALLHRLRTLTRSTPSFLVSLPPPSESITSIQCLSLTSLAASRLRTRAH